MDCPLQGKTSALFLHWNDENVILHIPGFSLFVGTGFHPGPRIDGDVDPYKTNAIGSSSIPTPGTAQRLFPTNTVFTFL